MADHFLSERVDTGREDLGGIAEAAKELCVVDVAKLYNPGRFAELAGTIGLAPGFVADSAVLEANGVARGFHSNADVDVFGRLQKTMDLCLPTGAPLCAAFCRLLFVTRYQRYLVRDAQRLFEGRRYLKVATDSYHRQSDRGRY